MAEDYLIQLLNDPVLDDDVKLEIHPRATAESVIHIKVTEETGEKTYTVKPSNITGSIIQKKDKFYT
jgi:hypothetical protein